MAILSEAVKSFLRSKESKILGKETAVKNLFILDKDKKKSEEDKKTSPTKKEARSYALLEQKDVEYGQFDLSKDDPDKMDAAINASIKAYPKDKTFAIKVFKSFLGFLEKKYGFKADIKFQLDFPSDFDRQMHIVKELHERGRGVEYFFETSRHYVTTIQPSKKTSKSLEEE
ncbi:hypothetical protein ACPUYX_11180 [Desulfosporosinus sp. SYSU MS00001]|uniref:hypothetical protein n=1 Tax=Desulfosporosinus sp. SYSU MS00001 TaxID=3416284 RepID=UPI003CEC0E00